jgi:glutamate synthase domain-containing protein 1
MSQDGSQEKQFWKPVFQFLVLVRNRNQLEDTQSGYRLYPLHKIPKKYFTPKFEFEIEIIVELPGGMFR